MGKINSYGLLVPLTEEGAAKIAQQIPGNATLLGKLEATAEVLMNDLAKGGVMIPPEWADRVEAALGTTDVPAIVEAIEKGVGKRGDATVVEWVVDPTQIQYYEGLAANHDLSLQRQLKATMDWGFTHGWVGAGVPEVNMLLVSPDQYRYLQQMFEKDIVTGTDLVEALRHQAGSPRIVSEEDDPVIEALG